MSPYADPLCLARGELADIDSLIRLLGNGLLVDPLKRRSGKGHETGAGGLEDTEGRNEFQEGVNSGLLSRTMGFVMLVIV